NLIPFATCTITIMFSPSSVGSFSSSFQINSNDPDEPTLNINLVGQASDSYLPLSGGGGGNIISSSLIGGFDKLIPPPGGFRFVIDNAYRLDKFNLLVFPLANLTFYGGNAYWLQISNTSTFEQKSSSDILKFKSSYENWSICKGKDICSEGFYNIYVKYYNFIRNEYVIAFQTVYYFPLLEKIIKMLLSQQKTSTVIEKISLEDESIPREKPVIPSDFRFTRYLRYGDIGLDVKYLQIFLNYLGEDTLLAIEGPGSPGNETTLFRERTFDAVVRFQEKYRKDILDPLGLERGTGFVGEYTIRKLNEMLEEMNQ
ncbi:MAG: peptidoglycan-binding protein, partial [Patescibacteria group bacterium]|nr:peptidoglycan-binding protein [Patescibacteria group bacterium]